MARLPSTIIVGGLLRAAEAAGGNGAVLAKGDPESGALLLVLTSRGRHPRLFERVSALTGNFSWNQLKSGESHDLEELARLIDKMKRFDRDLWAVELDIPNVEQFIVDSLAQT